MTKFSPLQEKWLQQARDGDHEKLGYQLLIGGNGAGRTHFLKALARAYDERHGSAMAQELGLSMDLPTKPDEYSRAWAKNWEID